MEGILDLGSGLPTSHMSLQLPCCNWSQVCMLLHWIFVVSGQPLRLHCLKPQLVSNMFFSRIVTAWFPFRIGVASAFYLRSRTSFGHILIACSLWIVPPAGAFRNILLKWWIANDCKHKCATKCNTKCSTLRLFSTTSKSQVSASKTLRKPSVLSTFRPSLAKYRCFYFLRTTVFWGLRCWTTAWQGLWFCKKLRNLSKRIQHVAVHWHCVSAMTLWFSGVFFSFIWEHNYCSALTF